MKKGARKEELIQRVESVSPSMIRNGKIYLGTLPSDKLMYLDSNEVMDTLCNLILYSLIRNEYKLDLRASDAKGNKNFKWICKNLRQCKFISWTETVENIKK